MFIAKSDKKQLLDYIQNRQVDSLKELKENNFGLYSVMLFDELLLIWNEKPSLNSYLPDMICVPDGKINEFLAWTSTYLRSTFFPFTAHCRVIDYNHLRAIQKIKIKNINKKIEGALLGAIIGETITLYEKSEIKHKNVLASKSTISYALARSYILGFDEYNYSIFDLYKNANSLISIRNGVFLDSVQEIWEILLMAFEDNSLGLLNNLLIKKESLLIAEALRDILHTNKVSSLIFEQLLMAIPNNSIINLNNLENRESKLIVLEKFVESLRFNADSLVDTFICAYLINDIAPGTFSHNNIIRNYTSSYPNLYIWYAILAGISSNSEILRYENGFGFRIMRDLFDFDSIYDRPKGDISINELEILMNAGIQSSVFMAESQTQINVELAPLIYTVLPVLKVTQNNSQLKEERLLKEEMLNQLGKTLSDTIYFFEKYTGKKLDVENTLSSKSRSPQFKNKGNNYNSINKKTTDKKSQF